MRKRILPTAAVGLLLAATVIFIFSQSLTPAAVSNQSSGAVTRDLLPMLRPVVEAIRGPLSAQQIHHFVRKAAHFCEFALLGGELALLLWTLGRRVLFSLYPPLFWGLSIAVTDEYLQSFLDRSPQVSDVVLDFSGVMAGIAAVLLLQELIRLLRQPK